MSGFRSSAARSFAPLAEGGGGGGEQKQGEEPWPAVAAAVASPTAQLSDVVMGPPLPPKHMAASHSPRLIATQEQMQQQMQHQQLQQQQRGGLPMMSNTMPPPQFSFGASYGGQQQQQHPTQWDVSQTHALLQHVSSALHHPVPLPPMSRHSLPPSYPSSLHAPPPMLHAPRPSMHPLSALALHYPESTPHDSRSRMRGDGFLLDDAEDEPLDLSNGETAEPLPLQLQRGASASGATAGAGDGNELMSAGEGYMDVPAQVRPRSADVTAASKLNRGISHDSASVQLVCPSCGEQPPGAEHESTFHAHITRCFITQHIGRPPRTPQASPMSSMPPADGSAGPIRKTRMRAASAASSTGGAAELASVLATRDVTTPESHGYHPYSHGNNSSNNNTPSPHLSNTLRQLRRTVDQMDLHQRISIMEAFHKLSRVASVEQQQAAAAHVMHPSPRGKRSLRSLTNSPSPKHRPTEDRVCKDILNLLYSPRVTAPHPSPMPGRAFVGLPSPLVIGVSHSAHLNVNGHGAQRSSAEEAAAAAAGRQQPSILGSPVAGLGQMDTLLLEPSHSSQMQMGGASPYQMHTPVKNFLYAGMGSGVPPPHSIPASERGDSTGAESTLSSPMIALDQLDGADAGFDSNASASDDRDAGAGSALALTGAFVHGITISSGASSPASTPSNGCSEQTSPSAPTDSSLSVDHSSSGVSTVSSKTFPAHCFPESSVIPPPPQLQSNEVLPEAAKKDNNNNNDGDKTTTTRTYGDEVAEKQRNSDSLRTRTTAAARG